MKFYSDAKQDEFVSKILNNKINGIYVDIGSNGSKNSNNSFYFDQNLNWKGFCIEIDGSYAPSYYDRKNCKLIIANALSIDYKRLFEEENIKVIDYLSIDVDTASLECLNIIPFDIYKAMVITIEHDAYLYGDLYRSKQREKLTNSGYELICSNVFVEQIGFDKKECPFEDWYVHPDFFSKSLIEKIKSDMLYPSQIINKFS